MSGGIRVGCAGHRIGAGAGLRGRQGRAAAAARGARAIDLDHLQRVLTAVDARAFLVSPRLIRRVIRRDCGLFFLGRQRVLQTTYVVRGASLAEAVEPSELSATAGLRDWPEWVFLIARPGPEDLASVPEESILLDTWRRYVRCRVQADVLARLADGRIDADGLARRLARVGLAEFEEARAVLLRDGLLYPPADTGPAYAAFAAHFLELTAFAPALLPVTFPAVESPEQVAAVLGDDVDLNRLLTTTRLNGTPDPVYGSGVYRPVGHDGHDNSLSETGHHEAPHQPERHGQANAAGGHPAVHDRLEGRGEVATAAGNDARAAVDWARAAHPRAGGHAEHPQAWEHARAAVDRIARRLQAALLFGEPEADRWSSALCPLLRRASGGLWTPEARLLYDLQNVCLDHERESYRLEPLSWILSLGRRPLRRSLPELREVTVARHLRSAAHRLTRVRVTRDDRAALESLIRPAVRRAEAAVRDRFRPRLVAALDAHWVAPRNLPERVARDKAVDDLLDRVVRLGHLHLSDLRDTASLSDLKLPDVTLGEVVAGGPLLRVDRELAATLPGVHRGGEVYLRTLQRVSMLAFGTPLGRALTLFVALPFGGAYVALEGLQHLLGWPVEKLTGNHLHLLNRWSLLLVGGVALAGINYVRFRAELFGVARILGRSLRAVAIEWPARAWNLPAVRAIRRSPTLSYLGRYGLKPGVLGWGVWWLTRHLGGGEVTAEAGGILTFLAGNLLLNTPPGRVLEEAAVEAFVRATRALVHEVVPGLVRWVMASFRAVLEAVEAGIYLVDEWLRFRSGQSRAALAGKLMLIPVWSTAAYLARLYVNLLIEPQVNPIKHFPVVTVSHKVILPLTIPLTRLFAAPLTPFLGGELAKVVAGANVILLPGLFGFLVWELKANWRLYAANRAGSLTPTIVGSHGETVVRLLRPGFHSGTVPKAFARLRVASRRAWPGPGRGRPEKGALKQREALHHVEEEVRSFLDREFVALLAGSKAFQDQPPRLGSIRLATNRVRFELIHGRTEIADALPAVWVDVEQRDGQLAAGVSESGWLDHLDTSGADALELAFIGLGKKCGVDWVQTPGRPVTTSPEPAKVSGAPSTETPRTRLGWIAVPWESWVAAWDAEERGDSAEPQLVPSSVLPSTTGAGRARAAAR